MAKKSITLSGKALACLKALISYDFNDECQTYVNYVTENYGEDEAAIFEDLTDAERIKYMEDAEDIRFAYYSLLVLSVKL